MGAESRALIGVAVAIGLAACSSTSRGPTTGPKPKTSASSCTSTQDGSPAKAFLELQTCPAGDEVKGRRR